MINGSLIQKPLTTFATSWSGSNNDSPSLGGAQASYSARSHLKELTQCSHAHRRGGDA